MRRADIILRNSDMLNIERQQPIKKRGRVISVPDHVVLDAASQRRKKDTTGKCDPGKQVLEMAASLPTSSSLQNCASNDRLDLLLNASPSHSPTMPITDPSVSVLSELQIDESLPSVSDSMLEVCIESLDNHRSTPLCNSDFTLFSEELNSIPLAHHRCSSPVITSTDNELIQSTEIALPETVELTEAQDAIQNNSPDQDLATGAESITEALSDQVTVTQDTTPQDTTQNNGTDMIQETSAIGNKRKARNGHGNPNTWINNVNKKQRMLGQGYCGRDKEAESGEYVIREPRVMGAGCQSKKCKKGKARACHLLTEEDRQRIFTNFWSNLNWQERKVYVNGLVSFGQVKRNTADKQSSRRNGSFFYFLRKETDRLPVCKNMFLSTLGLGEWSVRSWVLNSKDGIIPATESQGDESRATPTSEARDEIRKFLTCLPKLPSHYCRAESSKEYLETNFQCIADVYRLFCETHCQDGKPSRQVFNDEFHRANIGLYQPKKDRCDVCCAHEIGNSDEETYRMHQTKKDEARRSKEEDKKAAEDGQCDMIVMDVQAVQLVPQLQASSLYFKQKLAVHNFTFFNVANNQVVCYVWHEGEGEVTANIFTSCVVHYIETETGCNREIILYSDGCGSQNRNITLSNALLQVAKEKDIVITQKYLEKGHTQMECDSVHSVIERRNKNREIHAPCQYVQIIKESRTKVPYKVNYVDHTFFKNYSVLQAYSSIRPGRKVGDPTVTDLRCIRYTPSGQIYWKLRHPSDWQVQEPSRTSASRLANSSLSQLEPLYTAALKIKSGKYSDLQSLKNVLLADFHPFYDSLGH